MRTEFSSMKERDNCIFKWVCFYSKPEGKTPERQKKVRQEDYSMQLLHAHTPETFNDSGGYMEILCSLNISFTFCAPFSGMPWHDSATILRRKRNILGCQCIRNRS